MKKYLSIFLIFFLLFSVSVPAFAAETPIPPDNLDNLDYDNYIIVEDSNGYYTCLLYDSLKWSVYVKDVSSDDSIRYQLTFVSLDGSSGGLYSDVVFSSNYNPDLNNNGWGDFNLQTTYTDPYSDGSSYRWAFETFESLIDSNRSLYYGYLDVDTKQVVKGDIFFFNPMTLEGATAEALEQFQNRTTRTIMITVLCGVGCLAFLISLPILRKVLHRFLNR